MSNIDTARKKLIPLLGDMAALKPFADVGNPEAAEFVAALVAARAKARLAAKEYTDALRAEDTVA